MTGRSRLDGPEADAGEPDWNSVLPAWAGTRRWRLARAFKRGADLVLALVGIIVLFPFCLLVGLVIVLDSPGPVLHRMAWVGYRGRRFAGYKFRTMVFDAEQRREELRGFNEMTGPVFKMRNDPRVTRIGRFLRQSSIDELPQLWSVLRGDMSLVGPRAPGPHEYAEFTPAQRLKLAVTPGITCLWQISGRSSISEFEEWVQLDLKYIRDWSPWLDVKILLRTIPAVVRGRGAV